MATPKEKFDAILNLIKGHLDIKLDNAPPADPATQAATDAPAENTAKGKDGTEYRWQGDLKEGTAIMAVTPTGVEPPKDGNIELEDGTVLTISGGKVTQVTAATAAPDQGMSEEAIDQKITSRTTSILEKFTSQIEGLKTELSAVKTENENLKLAMGKTVELVELMNITPAEKVEKPVNALFANHTKEAQDNRLKELTENLKKLNKK